MEMPMNMSKVLLAGGIGVWSLFLFSVGPHARADDSGIVFGMEDDLTVAGTNGTSSDADVEIKGYTVFGGSGGGATVVTQGVGSVFAAGSLEVASNLYVTGNVGLGTSNPTNELAVNGTIKCKEIIVTTNGWADFVFEPDYELMPLADLEKFIEANGRLPDIPSAEDVASGGVKMGEMQAKMLQKIEELTLHVIALKKANAALVQRLLEEGDSAGEERE